MLSDTRIEQVLATLPGRTVGVLGDLFLDRYLDIDPQRDEPSLETGRTAYQVVAVRSYPGAAGTVINNLAALGVGRIVPIAFVGDDGEGYELRQALARLPAVDASGLILTPERRTPTYTKPMRDGVELNRLDIKNRQPTPPELQEELVRRLRHYWPQCEAWIVLDQVSEADCGVVTSRLRQELAVLVEQSPRLVLADSRERIGLFREVAVKPNARECRQAVGQPDGELASCVAALARQVGGRVFCTDGANGILIAEPGAHATDAEPTRAVQAVPAYPVHGPIDPVGAGDSCSAGIIAALLAGASPVEAAAFGNLVASITIQQLGVTGTASPQQVRRRWQEVSGHAGENA